MGLGSSVVAWGWVQVVNLSKYSHIETCENARAVTLPSNIKEFIEFYDVPTINDKVILYKAVHKTGKTYYSDYNRTFYYNIGEEKTENCDLSSFNHCSFGMNMATLSYSFKFGWDWKDLAILEVEANIEDIVVPEFSEGNLRTSKLKVLREVPLEECGTLGQIITKRNKIGK